MSALQLGNNRLAICVLWLSLSRLLEERFDGRTVCVLVECCSDSRLDCQRDDSHRLFHLLSDQKNILSCTVGCLPLEICRTVLVLRGSTKSGTWLRLKLTLNGLTDPNWLCASSETWPLVHTIISSRFCPPQEAAQSLAEARKNAGKARWQNHVTWCLTQLKISLDEVLEPRLWPEDFKRKQSCSFASHHHVRFSAFWCSCEVRS